jgi:flagellar motor switch protein FliM
MNLQAGDCLQLNHPTLNPVDLYVNGRLKFQGYIGLKGKQLAVKITAVVNQTGGGGNLHGSGKS